MKYKKTLAIILIFSYMIIYFKIVLANSESMIPGSNIELNKIEPELLSAEGETSVIISFSKKPQNYKQIISSIGGKIKYDYDLIEDVAVKIDAKDISKLAKIENLVKIHKDNKVQALLHDSAPLISADKVWSQGITGKDVKVCVIDTGVDYKHSALGSCLPSDNSESIRVESPHLPYELNKVYSWNITKENYTSISVHFTRIDVEPGYDWVYVKDANGSIVQKFTGNFSNVWSVSVPGNRIEINLVSDSMGSYYYGLLIDKVVNGSVSLNFSNCSKVIAGYNFIDDNGDPMDDNSHGTHVTGIISSNDPYSRGIANGTKILAAKVLDLNGNGYDSDVIAGIDWCVNNNAQIISMSLGGSEYSGTCDNDQLAIAVNNAVNRGTFVVVSAGNSGQYGVTTPACASGAIAVGATDKNNSVVGWSSKGPELDILAPGYKINSTILGNKWFKMSGTSMASPHVSGVIALMLEKNPLLSIFGIKKILNDTSDPVNKCYECTWTWDNIWNSWKCTNEYGSEISCTKNVIGSGIVNASKVIEYLSRADCEITVQYQDGCPRSGASVYIVSPETIMLGTTDENGKVSCSSLIDNNYTLQAKWPNVDTQFGDSTTLQISNRYGRAIIQNSQPGENEFYPNGTETCGGDECSGLKYCVGDTKYIECDSWNSICDTKKCCQCNGGTQSNPLQNYNSTQNQGCNLFNLEGISTCDWDPDNYHPTWDYRVAYTSYCVGIDQCSQGNPTISHSCNVSQCGAQCDTDCSPNTCSQTYSDYCTGKNLTEYNNNNVLDNTIVTDSCNNNCQNDCTCTNCQVNCNAPPTKTHCVKNVCGAECDSNNDCVSRTCLDNCACLIDKVPPILTISSPNITTYYYKMYIPLVFTISKPTSWIGYSLNNTLNKTITGPINLTGLANGWNNVTIYANDTSGNMGSSFVNFSYCYGDVNGDKKINIIDTFSTSLLYGKNCGDPKYNATFDINDDCKINLVDVFSVNLHYGKNC